MSGPGESVSKTAANKNDIKETILFQLKVTGCSLQVTGTVLRILPLAKSLKCLFEAQYLMPGTKGAFRFPSSIINFHLFRRDA
ncbi:MAG: hypothetical protein IJW39_02630, partial [Opitutales bacterium]|nr:hypothetical protein [Opitutales bacterium]